MLKKSKQSRDHSYWVANKTLSTFHEPDFREYAIQRSNCEWPAAILFRYLSASRQSNDSIGVNVKVKVRCVQYAISTYLFTEGRWKQGLPNAYFSSAQRNDAKKEQAESGAFSLLLGSK